MNWVKRIISFILVAVLGILTPISSVAASAKKVYVSDIIAYKASSYDEAKSGLESMGYEIAVNGTLYKSDSVGYFLGYKTTEDPDEAITDIAAMNMLGNYSYSDYDELMEKNRDIVRDTVLNFETAIGEFQTNFANGTPEAQMAYDSINMFCDDDSGKRMGDYLLDYDFSAKAQEELTETIMEANSDIIMAIMQNVSMACDAEETSLFDRMESADPDTLLERYTGIGVSVAKANQAMERDFSATAADLRVWWDDFYYYLVEIEEEKLETNEEGALVPKDGIMDVHSGINMDNWQDESDKVKEYVQTISDMTELAMISRNAEDIALYLQLLGTSYMDGTLLDFFKRPLKDVTNTELYVLTDAMSEGQRAQLGILGIRNTLIGASVDLDESEDETAQTVETNAQNKELDEPISIYQDIDRSIFEQGVALAGSAVKHQQLTGESWLAKLTGAEERKDDLTVGIIASSIASVATLSAGIVLAVMQRSYKSPYLRRYLGAKADYEQALETWVKWEKATEKYTAVKIVVSDAITDVEVDAVNVGRSIELEIAKREYDSAKRLYESAGKNAGRLKCLSFAMFVIALALDIYFIWEYFSTEDPEEEKIPHHLLAAIDTEYGEDYVYYKSVRDQNDVAFDMNNHENPKVGWLVLYQTHEKNAGAPILAKDLKIVTGSNDFDVESSFAHLFDEVGAVNLTADIYTGKTDTAKGTYVLFNRDTSAYAASAITGGVAALLAIGGAIIGTGVGLVLGLNRNKKKEQ